MTSVRVPITNTFAKGGYSAKLFLGEQRLPLNLILDSGSSVLAVRASCYDGDSDSALRATSLAQHIRYGKGGWSGPVITTSLRLGLHTFSSQLNGVAVALAHEDDTGCFLDADGILGLAYQAMDQAFDISSLLASLPGSDAESYPDLIRQFATSNGWDSRMVSQCPKTSVTPYFTQLEEQGITANQFALYTHRSSIYRGESAAHYRSHLNHGVFVVGKPHLHADLHDGKETVASVVHDRYYNVHVTGVRVGNAVRHDVPALEESHRNAYCSNGIVDSGASYLVLPQVLFAQIKRDLIRFNPAFETPLADFGQFTGEEQGVSLDTLDLSAWPEITLYLQGQTNEEAVLTLSPDTYWQAHAPRKNQASFKICWLADWPNQLILGLPVLNNYYTIFDRATGVRGCIRFLQKRAPTRVLKQTLQHVFHPTPHHQDHHE